jgi:hypothetical protein
MHTPAGLTLEQQMEQTLREQMRLGMDRGVNMQALMTVCGSLCKRVQGSRCLLVGWMAFVSAFPATCDAPRV